MVSLMIISNKDITCVSQRSKISSLHVDLHLFHVVQAPILFLLRFLQVHPLWLPSPVYIHVHRVLISGPSRAWWLRYYTCNKQDMNTRNFTWRMWINKGHKQEKEGWINYLFFSTEKRPAACNRSYVLG